MNFAELRRRDWFVAVAFFAASLALRVPFRSHWAYHWDSATFALAMENYNPRLGQPHMPGYFVYVLMGRLVNYFLGDPHASLVWLSVVAGAALAALGYRLAATMFGRAAGLATGVILATSPLTWFQSEVALTTIVDGALVTATMLAGWRAKQHGGRWRDVLVLAALLAWVAGNRPQSAVGLLPAWLYLFMQFTNRPAKLIAGVGLVGLFCLLWLLPLVRTAGGWRDYVQLLAWKLEFDAPRSGWNGAAFHSLGLILRTCGAGLSVAMVIAALNWRQRATGDARLLVWWIAPLATLGVLTYTAMPGHVLSYFPALAIVAGRACGRRWAVFTIALVNCAVFLGTGPARQIREHDRQMAEACAVVCGYRPDEVLLCHRQEFFLWGIPQFQYHLPEYQNSLLGRDVSLPAERAGQYRVCRGAQTEFVDDWLTLARGKKLLLVVPPGEPVTIFADRVDVTRAVPVGEGLYELSLDGRNAADEYRAP